MAAVRVHSSPSREEAADFFRRLLVGSSAGEIDSLLNIDALRDNVYVYNPITRSAVHPQSGELSWPLLYLLGSHHRKFVAMGRSMPSLCEVRRALKQWEWRFKWSWKLRNSSVLCGPNFAGKHRSATPFREVAPPEIEAWCAQ